MLTLARRIRRGSVVNTTFSENVVNGRGLFTTFLENVVIAVRREYIKGVGGIYILNGGGYSPIDRCSTYNKEAKA